MDEKTGYDPSIAGNIALSNRLAVALREAMGPLFDLPEYVEDKRTFQMAMATGADLRRWQALVKEAEQYV